jgi:hypothetical protein
VTTTAAAAAAAVMGVAIVVNVGVIDVFFVVAVVTAFFFPRTQFTQIQCMMSRSRRHDVKCGDRT